MFWIVADVVGRTAFSRPITGTSELAAVSLIAIIFLQLPHSLRGGHFLRSTMLVDRQTPRKQAVLNIVASTLGVTLFALAVVSTFDPTISVWRRGEFEGGGPVRILVGPFRTIILVSSALVAIQFLAALVKDISSLRKSAG